MNGLVIRDYVHDGLGESPMHFAEGYYLQYPKIAPLMWPPLFHVTLGLLLLPGWSPQTVSLMLIAAFGAWTAWRLSRIVEQATDAPTGYVAAGLFAATTLVIDMTSVVMLDIVVAALALEATYWLALFFERRQRRHAIAFGIAAACCCLTKGNGLTTVLVPPLAIALTGNFRIIRDPGLWIAGALVTLLALPLLVYSFSVDSAMGGYSAVSAGQAWARANSYSRGFLLQFGVLLIVFACLGILMEWRRPTTSARSSLPRLMAALFIAGLMFHAFTPHEAAGLRYMTLGVAPILALATIGVRSVSRALVFKQWRAVNVTLLGLMIFNFVLARPAVAYHEPLGYRDVVRYLDDQNWLAARRSLVVSNETGEGAFVAEVATLHRTPAPTVVRGSKLIAFSNWGGEKFRLNLKSPSALLERLEELHIETVVIDRSVRLPYSALVDDTITSYPLFFERVLEVQHARHLTVYRFMKIGLTVAKPLDAEVGHSDASFSSGNFLRPR
jgi:hypothetical protein